MMQTEVDCSREQNRTEQNRTSKQSERSHWTRLTRSELELRKLKDCFSTYMKDYFRSKSERIPFC